MKRFFFPRFLLWGLSRLRGCFASPVAVGGGGFVYYSLFGSPSLPSLITNEQRPFLNATWWRWNFPYITCKCDTSSNGLSIQLLLAFIHCFRMTLGILSRLQGGCSYNEYGFEIRFCALVSKCYRY